MIMCLKKIINIKTLRVFITLIVFSISFVGTVQAQSSASTQIFIVPNSNLRAGDVFSVGLTSSDINLSRSEIEWYINGKLGLEGIGKEGFTSFTGPVGTTLVVKAVITSPNGTIIRKTVAVRPQEIDFLWRANTHTPAFYKGRSLATSGSYVSITAMPNVADPDGKSLAPSKLTYNWSQNSINLGSASGVGKQTIVLENPQTKNQPLQVKVVVTDSQGLLRIEETVVIPFSKPKILFYEHLPLNGVAYQNAIFEKTLLANEMVLHAEPYYFSSDDFVSGNLSYKWKINGNRVTEINKEKPNELVLRKSDEDGEARLELEVLNNNLPFRIFQEAVQRLRVKL